MKKEIKTENAPNPVGPYSQAVESQGFLYLSGQIGIDPGTNELVSDKIENQTLQVLANLKSVLSEANLDFSSVVKADIFLKDMNDYGLVNEIYANHFSVKPYPARVTVAVSDLPKGALVEISFIAEGSN